MTIDAMSMFCACGHRSTSLNPKVAQELTAAVAGGGGLLLVSNVSGRCPSVYLIFKWLRCTKIGRTGAEASLQTH